MKRKQSNFRNRERLASLKWERALVSYVLHWAEKQGIPEVRMIRGEDQVWVKEGKLQPQQARMLYDVTAQRVRYQGRKFLFDETSKQYVFRLGERK